MTTNNLTEQWKKGELKTGWYYVKNEFGNIFVSEYSKGYDHINERIEKDFFTEASDITEIIYKVPSYEEWKDLKEFADYSLHNRDELTRQINFWMDKHTQIEKENQRLKELLRECEYVIAFEHEVYEEDTLIKQIDEVLK